MTFKIPIQPMSLNNFYRNAAGRGRVKTAPAKKWCEDVYLMLPSIEPPELPFGLRLTFGTPYYNTADLDNMVKPVVDVMQAKWDFNDKLIDHYILAKVKTKKFAGYIEFQILTGENNGRAD